MHEAQMHTWNSFITLTYDDDHLPEDLSVDVRHNQLFMKRLRKKYGQGIRFFHCGEYGDLNGRPHYHSLIFGLEFPDKELYKVTKDDNRLYSSKALNDLWGFGFTIIGDVTFESAAYTARYVMKKRTGEGAKKYYEWVHPLTGEVFERKPEYITMSRNPGIGSSWFDKYKTDVFPDDFVVINGKKLAVPRWYVSKLEEIPEELDDKGRRIPGEFRLLKRRRLVSRNRHAWNNTRERLRVREVVHLAKISRLKRSL